MLLITKIITAKINFNKKSETTTIFPKLQNVQHIHVLKNCFIGNTWY
jgi:hypothetical protein